jgi:Cytochrome bd terminal oxidase subunit I
MDATALLLLRIQFRFTISFHIIFPAFTIGIAAWLTVLEAMHLKTDRPMWALRLPAHVALHGDRLPRFRRQGRIHVRPLLMRA